MSRWSWPWPEPVSSGPRWHIAGRQARSTAGSRSAAPWQQMKDTPAEERGPCLHPSARSTWLSAEASASGCTPRNSRNFDEKSDGKNCCKGKWPRRLRCLHWLCAVCTHRLVQVVSHRVCQRSYSVVKDEQVLVLVLPESKHQRIKDEAQVGHQLRTCFLLQGGKCTEDQNNQVVEPQDEQTRLKKKKKKKRKTYLHAASCTLLLPSRIRLSSSVMRGLRWASGGWLTTQWA